MQNLFQELVELLSSDDRLVSEGKLMKNKVVELALNLDPILLKHLLKSESLKKHFFGEVEGVLIFDKIKFQKFVSNKKFLPDSFTAFKNKIGLGSGDEYLCEVNDVVLAWPYKDCVLEGGQDKEDAIRKEVFWNETLAPDQIDRLTSPKAITGWLKFSKNGKVVPDSVDSNSNLIIKGNNLLALSTIAKTHEGKIKLIYIDPPYNTGNDSFKYNDNFTHSTWLTFMQNRLLLAKRLLRNDGVICIQLDSNEVSYCRVLLDEIFGRENFRNEIIVRRGTKNVQSQFETIDSLSTGHDTILVVSKNPTTRLKKLTALADELSPGKWDTFWRGTDRPTMRYKLFDIKPESGQWRWSEERAIVAKNNYEEFLKNHASNMSLDDYFGLVFQETGKEIEFVRRSDDGVVQYYVTPRNYKILSDVWMDVSTSGGVTEFSHEKHEELLERIIRWLSEENEFVLDFFLGSGSTCAVALKTRRKFIGIEQMDYINSTTVERLIGAIAGDQGGISKAVEWAGGGEFVYCELAQANQVFVDAIQSAKSAEELLAIWNTMQEKAFLSYRVNPKAFDDSKNEFVELSLADQKKFLIETLDKNMLYVPLSEIDDETYEISDADKALNKKFFG